MLCTFPLSKHGDACSVPLDIGFEQFLRCVWRQSAVSKTGFQLRHRQKPLEGAEAMEAELFYQRQRGTAEPITCWRCLNANKLTS